MKTIKALLVAVLAIFALFSGASVWGSNYTSTGAGGSLSGGDWNAFVGGGAGDSVITGNYNVAVGQNAGSSSSGSMSNSVAIGYYSGSDNTGPNTVSIGDAAGSGAYNVCIGSHACLRTTSGNRNTCIGHFSCSETVDGFRNTYIGGEAGSNNVSGDHNIFIGTDAGKNELGSNRLYIAPSETTAPLIYGEFDTNKLVVNGDLIVTGRFITGYAGTGDTYLGEGAGQNNSSGSYNTSIGSNAGFMNSTGINNTYVGEAAGYTSTGSGNIFLGYQAGYFETGSNKLYIANNSVSPLIYGDFDTHMVKIYGSLTMASDERLKKNIEALHSSLDKILRLRGVTYRFKGTPQEGRGFGGQKEIGLIAQEVEKVIPEVVHTDGSGLKSVAYSKLVPVLIEAVKEEQKQIEQNGEILDNSRIERLERAVKRIEKRLARIDSPLITAVK